MSTYLPTYGQLERDLSQRILKLYREEIKHFPGKITCSFFSNYLVVVIEDSLTTLEKTLIDEGKVNEIVRNFNSAINDLIKFKLKIALEEVLAVEVGDILLDSSLKTQHTGAIVTFNQLPLVRSRKSATKIKQSLHLNKSVDEDDSSQADNHLETINNSISIPSDRTRKELEQVIK